ncbi:MAG: carboxypeptidase regulatory-like domain-containing protein [Candidatus Hydrogenedentes bacterium]|nr:carboxypeptidase regulatory-like domain-containing protein [Candidatus Hydrogenedentota bacterium]
MKQVFRRYSILGLGLSILCALALLLYWEPVVPFTNEEQTGFESRVGQESEQPLDTDSRPAGVSRAVGSVAVQKPGPGTIMGIVIGTDGIPAQGATVRVQARRSGAEEPPAATVDADASGAFAIHDLQAGRYDIFAKLADAVAIHSVRLTSAEPVARIRLSLRAGRPLGGLVLDPSGSPCPGATVVPFARDGEETSESARTALSVETGEDGRFLFESLEDGVWQLRASATGFAPALSSPAATGTEDTVIHLTHGGIIAGTLVNATDDSPIPGIRIGISESSKRTKDVFAESGEDGSLEFAALPEGEYLAYLDDPLLVLVEPIPVVAVREGTRSTGVLLRADRGAVVTGRIYDAATQEGIEGAAATAWPVDRPGKERRSEPADEMGHYRLDGVSPGRIRLALTAVPPEYLVEGTKKDMVLELGMAAAEEDFALSMGVTVRGSVLNPDGAPVAGAAVTAHVMNGGLMPHAASNAEGLFVLTGFKGGESITLWAKTPESITSEAGPFHVPPEGLSDIQLTIGIPANGSIAGMVVDKTGMPVRCAVFAETANEAHRHPLERPHGTSSANGQFVIAGLPEGEYELMLGEISPRLVQSSQYAATVHLAEGEHLGGVRLVFEADPQSTISGRVTDEANQPIAGAQVLAAGLDPGDTVDRPAYTRPDGTYSVTGLSGTSYQLHVNHDTYGAETAREVAAGSTDVDFVLRPRPQVSGIVVDAMTSQPVTQFEIAAVPGRSSEDGVDLGRAQFQAVSNAAGEFRIALNGGARMLVVQASGYERKIAPLGRVRGGDTVDGLVIPLTPGGISLEGIVRDGKGNAVTGAVVSAAGEGVTEVTQTQSGVDGRFRLTGVSDGALHVSAYHSQHGAGSALVSLATGQETPVEIVLQAFGIVEGVVTLDGEPLSDVPVTVLGGAGHRGATEVTDGDGQFAINSVPAGSALVRVQVPASEDDVPTVVEQEVTVPSGEVVQVDFAIESDSDEAP